MAEYIVKARLSDLFGIKNKGELIRCRDCRFRNTDACITKQLLPDDFYCGQGTPKDGEQE